MSFCPKIVLDSHRFYRRIFKCQKFSFLLLLFLYRPQRKACDEKALHKGIKNNYRQRGNHHFGRVKGSLGRQRRFFFYRYQPRDIYGIICQGLNIRLQRYFTWCVNKKHSVKKAVPVCYHRENSDCGNGGHGEGHVLDLRHPAMPTPEPLWADSGKSSSAESHCTPGVLPE